MRKQRIILATFALFLFATTRMFATTKDASRDEIQFNDVKAQTMEFIGYNGTITLSKQQEEIKQKALSAVPAPCCSDFSIATCCCPCNLAKSVWGLSNYLIVNKNYDAERLKVTVVEWLNFTNKNGYTGDACSQGGGCGRPFKDNGCGGMKDDNVSF